MFNVVLKMTRKNFPDYFVLIMLLECNPYMGCRSTVFVQRLQTMSGRDRAVCGAAGDYKPGPGADGFWFDV
jgi:hypothetical protein